MSQSTNPDELDEILAEHRNTTIIADMIAGPKTRMKAFAKSDAQTKARIQEYVTLARIDEMSLVSSDERNVLDWDYHQERLAALQRDSQPNVSPTIQNPERVSENGVSDSQPGDKHE